MDLLEEIFKSLDGKEYDDFTKIRWIYLYVCEKFSYDTRYIFATKGMKESIYNKEVNITNVEDFEIVCYTLSRILVDILTEFGYKSEIKKETDRNLTHVYIIVNLNGEMLKLDPTKRHDVTRVKMNNTTKDFESLEDDDLFADHLLEADKKIADDFNNLYFSDKSIVRIAKNILKMIDTEASEKNLSKAEIFFKKLETLCIMVNERTNLKRYDDIDFFYSYLLRLFKINKKEVEKNGIIEYENYSYIKPIVLFKKNDKTMKDIINISYIQYEDLPPMFYLLKKENESFKIREIFKDEAMEILNEYESPLCQYMLEEIAKKLQKNNQNGIIY